MYKCEIDMLTLKQHLANDCEIKTTKIQDMWIPLQHTNRWIYVLHKDYAVDIICGDEIEHSRIRRDCTLKHDTLELSGQNNFQNEIMGSILPQFNLGPISSLAV